MGLCVLEGISVSADFTEPGVFGGAGESVKSTVLDLSGDTRLSVDVTEPGKFGEKHISVELTGLNILGVVSVSVDSTGPDTLRSELLLPSASSRLGSISRGVLGGVCKSLSAIGRDMVASGYGQGASVICDDVASSIWEG